MKKSFLALIAIAAISFATSYGHAEKNTPVIEKLDLHAVSSNAP